MSHGTWVLLICIDWGMPAPWFRVGTESIDVFEEGFIDLHDSIRDLFIPQLEVS